MDTKKIVNSTFLSMPNISNKRKSYTIEEKVLFIELIADGRKTQSEICNEYNISNSTISTIISNKEQILSNYKKNDSYALRKRNRGSKFEDIEKLLLDWYQNVKSKAIKINGAVIRAKANEFATLLNKKHEFKASNGWFQRFKIRNNIQLSSCSSSVSDEDERISSTRRNKRPRNDNEEVLSNYDLKDSKSSEFSFKSGSLDNLDEEEESEYNFASNDEFNSKSNLKSDPDNNLNIFKEEVEDNDEFNETEYFQENSLEVPNRQEALNYLYKLRSFFETTEKVSAIAMKSLDDIENELLNG